MDHYLQEELNNLIEFLKRNYNKNNYNNDSSAALEADIVWDAARFWANVLYKGKFRALSLNLIGFQNFKNSYEKTNNIIIDDKLLIATYWLRNVLGFITIPTAISSACISFENIKLYKNELIFLLHFQVQSTADSNLYDKDDIEAARLEYETKNYINLSDEGLYGRDRKWAGIKEGNKIQLSNMDAYFKVYLDHWDKFEFISAYKNERLENRKKDFVIDATEFEALHVAYSSLFEQMPPIDALLQDNVLDKEGEQYSINFYGNKAEYWGTLREKISGFLWELYNRDETIISNSEKIKKWLNVVENWENLGDPLQYVTIPSRGAFLEAAYELVSNEQDLDGIDSEFEKILLDNRWKRSVYVPGKEILKKLDDSDLFELMQSFVHFENNADTTYLYGQHSRHFVGLLIQLLVKYDAVNQHTFDENGINGVLNFHKKIKELLRAGLSKPYLMWETTRFILLERPEIIAYLIMEPDLASLSFTLIDEIRFADKEKEYLNAELWKFATNLLLKTFTTKQPDIPVNSKIIFQVYRQLNHKKYTLPYSGNQRANSDGLQKIKKQKEEDVLSLIENTPLQFIYSKPVDRYILPELFDELATLFTGFSTSANQFGYINFPMIQWDGMFWLMKASTYYKYSEQLKFNPVDISGLTSKFIKAYLNLMELEEIRKFDHKENKEVDGLPHWSERIERLGILDWLYPIYLIYKNGKLSQFLAPRFDVEVTDDLYNEKNILTASRIRTHIGVLIQVLKKLVLPAIPYGLTKKALDEIKNRIEMQITDYIKTHTVKNPSCGKIDLFEFNKESKLINPSDKEALLPQIARAINWFNDKNLIIDAIIQSGDLGKILVIADLIISEGIRKKLFNHVKKADLITYLENLRWIPEIQNAMIKISGHPELLCQLEEVIGYWEKHIVTRENQAHTQYVSQLYRAKLLAAYFKNDEKALNEVELPSPPMVNNPHELTDYDYKQFYNGLVKIKDNPEGAAEIFDQLHKKFPDVASFTLNRFVAKYYVAEKQDNSDNLNQAFEE